MRRLAFLLILIALLAALRAPFAAAQDPAVLRPQEASLQLQPGQTATVTILLEDARDVYAIDVRGRFDPALVEVVDAEANRDGTQMGMGFFPVPEFVARNAADNAAGTLQYAITQVNPTPPAFGRGIVMTIELRGKATGTTSLAFDTVEMADRSGILLDVTAQPLAITVGTPGATPTDIALLQPTAAASGTTATPAATATAQPETNTAVTMVPEPSANAPAAPTAVLLETAIPADASPSGASGLPDNTPQDVAPAPMASGESPIAEPVNIAESADAPSGSDSAPAATGAFEVADSEAVTAASDATAPAAVIGSGETVAEQEAGSAEAETNSSGASPSSGLLLLLVAAAALVVTTIVLTRQRSR